MLSLQYENQNSSGLEKNCCFFGNIGRAGLSYPFGTDVSGCTDAAFCGRCTDSKL